MALILFLIIFSTAFVLFSDEINVLFKKIFAARWLRIIAPIGIVSFLWVFFDEEVLWSLQYLQLALSFIAKQSARVLPHKLAWVTQALTLYLMASIPAWVLHWGLSRRPFFSKKTHRITYFYVFSWLFFSMLILH